MRTKMFNKFMKDKGLNEEQMDYMLDTISYMESKNQNIPQKVTDTKNETTGYGPGQGFFQIEDHTGSNTVETLMNQYVNVMGDTPSWLGTYEDLKDMSLEQQQDLFLAGIYVSERKGGSDARLKRYAEGDQTALREIWLDDWWKGPDKDREARIKRYDADLAYRESSDNKVFDNMVNTTTPVLDYMKSITEEE